MVNILVPAPGSTVKFYYEGGGTPVAVTRSHGQQWSEGEKILCSLVVNTVKLCDHLLCLDVKYYVDLMMQIIDGRSNYLFIVCSVDSFVL